MSVLQTKPQVRCKHCNDPVDIICLCPEAKAEQKQVFQKLDELMKKGKSYIERSNEQFEEINNTSAAHKYAQQFDIDFFWTAKKAFLDGIKYGQKLKG